MGNERPVISNPKGNNRLLVVTALGQQGQKIKLATIKPGSSFRPEKSSYSVHEIPLPTTIDATRAANGTFMAPLDAHETASTYT